MNILYFYQLPSSSQAQISRTLSLDTYDCSINYCRFALVTVNAISPLYERSFFMAMKIVRFNCCGMDVHKNLVVATIGITDRKTNITEYFQRSFSTLNSDLYRLKDWLKSPHCSDVCMESTGKYWIPIFNLSGM